MKSRWIPAAAIAVISFFSGGWLLQQGVQQPGNVYQQARLFDDVLSHVHSFYVDSLGESELYHKATEGLLDQLHDPYSVLLTGQSFRDLTETTTGNYGGLGIQIDVRDGWITIIAPLPDTPAERAGIETGDQIVEVNGTSTEGWKNEEAVRALRGEPGSTIRIKIRRAGVDQPIPYTLTRAEIHLRSVAPGTMFDDGIGYVALTPVSETSAEELRSEIEAMRQRGMRRMILDLRGNPGGLLDQGVQVTDLFLNAGQVVVETRGRARGATRRFVDQAQQAWPQMPLVVLVDEASASAAEIIAGALQDHDRALLVGTPTFGKGLVQTLYPLADEVALKLTTARWLTPSGRTIQRQARNPQEQYEQAVRAARPDSTTVADSARPAFHTDAGRLVYGGGGIVPDLLVPEDTLTAAEQALSRELGESIPVYRDVLTSYALELKNGSSIRRADFVVTPAMRQAVYQRLRERGVALREATFNAAADLVDRQLGYEVARYVLGRPAEFERRARDDRQVQAALGLLRRATSPQELLTLVPATR